MKSWLLGAVCACIFWLSTSLAQAALVTVPGTLENTEGNSSNSYPFNLNNVSVLNMRHQQIYSASKFSVGGIVDEIRFRVDNSGISFTTSNIDIKIDLAYAATTVATASATFASNIGSGLVTVLDTTNLSLSGNNEAGLNPFNIVIDVADLFVYDPTMGDLLIDIYMRNSPATTLFDFEDPTTTVTSRVYSSGGVSDLSGTAKSNGLVTQFELQPVPIPPSVWLFGSGLLGLVGMARRKKAHRM